MTDKIGVLGEATTASAATTTVYTCPAAKAARVKVMWSGLSHASTGTGDLTITVNAIIMRFSKHQEHKNHNLLLIQSETKSRFPTRILC